MEMQEIENIAYELILKNRKPMDIAELKGERVPKGLAENHIIYVGAISDFLLALTNACNTQTKTTKSISKDAKIYELRDFKKYSIPRRYNSRTKCWTTTTSRGKSFYFPFESLIKLIENYKNNIPLETTFKQIESHVRTSQGLQYYEYMYRAGAFNDAIYENARKYGYDPQDLISNECEHLKSNPKRKRLTV